MGTPQMHLLPALLLCAGLHAFSPVQATVRVAAALSYPPGLSRTFSASPCLCLSSVPPPLGFPQQPDGRPFGHPGSRMLQFNIPRCLSLSMNGPLFRAWWNGPA
eukprot:EG_transcript_22046